LAKHLTDVGVDDQHGKAEPVDQPRNPQALLPLAGATGIKVIASDQQGRLDLSWRDKMSSRVDAVEAARKAQEATSAGRRCVIHNVDLDGNRPVTMRPPA